MQEQVELERKAGAEEHRQIWGLTNAPAITHPKLEEFLKAFSAQRDGQTSRRQFQSSYSCGLDRRSWEKGGRPASHSLCGSAEEISGDELREEDKDHTQSPEQP